MLRPRAPLVHRPSSIGRDPLGGLVAYLADTRRLQLCPDVNPSSPVASPLSHLSLRLGLPVSEQLKFVVMPLRRADTKDFRDLL